MQNINLDITKAAQFLSEGAVKAYESKVKAAQEALKTAPALVTISSDGFTFHQRQQKHSSMR